jgi:prepilin-type N-terminal cleavage/methylation domain-containing protein
MSQRIFNSLLVISSRKKVNKLSSAKNLLAYRQAQHNDGFTLLEMITVVVIIGILSAIVAPSWLAFTNRQRVNKANDVIFAAIQEAQREAKRMKINYSVSFTTDANQAQIAVHPAAAIPNISNWRNIGADLGIKGEQVIIGTNISAKNKTNITVDYATKYSDKNQQTITFDYMGVLAQQAGGNNNDDNDEYKPLKVVVAVPKSGSTTDASDVKRCVIVETLIGGLRTAKDNDCK